MTIAQILQFVATSAVGFFATIIAFKFKKRDDLIDRINNDVITLKTEYSTASEVIKKQSELLSKINDKLIKAQEMRNPIQEEMKRIWITIDSMKLSQDSFIKEVINILKDKKN